MTLKDKQLLNELKESCTECEICGLPCKFINYDCRDPEDGSMAEVINICKECHNKWSLCHCNGDKK